MPSACRAALSRPSVHVQEIPWVSQLLVPEQPACTRECIPMLNPTYRVVHIKCHKLFSWKILKIATKILILRFLCGTSRVSLSDPPGQQKSNLFIYFFLKVKPYVRFLHWSPLSISFLHVKIFKWDNRKVNTLWDISYFILIHFDKKYWNIHTFKYSDYDLIVIFSCIMQ